MFTPIGTNPSRNVTRGAHTHQTDIEPIDSTPAYSTERVRTLLTSLRRLTEIHSDFSFLTDTISQKIPLPRVRMIFIPWTDADNGTPSSTQFSFS